MHRRLRRLKRKARLPVERLKSVRKRKQHRKSLKNCMKTYASLVENLESSSCVTGKAVPRVMTCLAFNRKLFLEENGNVRGITAMTVARMPLSSVHDVLLHSVLNTRMKTSSKFLAKKYVQFMMKSRRMTKNHLKMPLKPSRRRIDLSNNYLNNDQFDQRNKSLTGLFNACFDHIYHLLCHL